MTAPWPRNRRRSGGLGEAALSTPVLILGGHLTGLGVLRLLAVRGIPVYGVLAPADDMVVHSRWYRPVPGTLDETPDSTRLEGFLDRLPVKRAVLMPCTDGWARAVAGLSDETRSRFPASVAPQATVEQFVDKDGFRALMDMLGVPQPHTRTIDGEDLSGIDQLEVEAGFLKPTDSQRFAAHFEGKGLWATDLDDVRERVIAARAAGVSLMLQEWIPGDPSHNVLVDCFVDRRGTITGLLARRKIRMMPPRIGNTASAVTIPLGQAAGPVAATRAIIARTGYRGVFSAEFKLDDRDGEYKILEVNARLYWYVGHTAAAGLDLVWMSYQDALELSVDRVRQYRTGVYGLYEMNDAAAIKLSLIRDRRVNGPVLRPWILGHRALFSSSDPAPALVVLKAHLGRLVGRGA